MVENKAQLGRFQISIGSTDVWKSSDLFYNSDETSKTDTDGVSSDEEDQSDMDWFEDECVNGTFDFDSYLLAATSAGHSRGIHPQHLSKVWKISHEDAKRTIDSMTQHSVRTNNPSLSRNYGTNDRMLRYKRLNSYFFMGTFFLPMKLKSEVLQALKNVAKEIGEPDVIVCDMSGEQTSQPLRKFCSDIGTTLRALEEGTPWSNKADLYIGLIKESTRKDMCVAKSPIAFWDYCIERRARINNLTAKSDFKLHGTTAHTALTGDEGDISNQHPAYDVLLNAKIQIHQGDNSSNLRINRNARRQVNQILPTSTNQHFNHMKPCCFVVSC